MIFFIKGSKSKVKKIWEGGGARVSDFFYRKHNKKKKIFFFSGGWGLERMHGRTDASTYTELKL